MAATSEEERQALETFRQAILHSGLELTATQQGDISLMPWLREKELNVSKALEMLTKHYERRRREDIDNILLWKPPRNYEEIFPYDICGRTKDYCPILIVPFGQYDLRSAVEKGEKDAWIRHVEQIFAKTYKYMDELNTVLEPGVTPVTQCFFICDVNGFSIRQITTIACVKAVIEITQCFKDNYPDLFSTMCFINAPRAFSVLFSIIKPILPTRLLSKTEIFTIANHEKCKQFLLAKASPDQLPIALGGIQTNTCKFYQLATEEDTSQV